jgi:triosephosphate isomerase (TIM)
MFIGSTVDVGAQGCSEHARGKFTSQIHASSLNELGCSYAIVGHAEQREYLGHSNSAIARQCTQLMAHGVTPIVCVGENKQALQEEATAKTLEAQLEPVIAALSTIPVPEPAHELYIAYEPIYAIGTGLVAEPEHIENTLAWLAAHCTEKLPQMPVKLLYGGSVSSKNVASLTKIDEVGGFLVGGASLDFQEFEKIVKSV